VPDWTLRLVDVLGAPLDDIAEPHLQALVDNGVREDADLDFKRDQYGMSDSAKREMAGDIAAMANDRGGLLIIGVADENDVAVKRTPVDIEGGDEARIRQTAASLIVPHVHFEIRVVSSNDTAGRGYYLLLIPPSPLRPHAVRKDQDLRYPRRDGTTTRWLSEAEVADMYRDRFRSTGDQIGRLEAILDEGRDQILVREDAWVAVAVVPDIPGSTSISLERVNEIAAWAAQFGSGDYWRGFYPTKPMATAGVRRFRVAPPTSRGEAPWWVYSELYVDGAGFAAYRLQDPRQNADGTDTWIVNEHLVMALARAMKLLGRHAVENTGAAGDVVLEAKLVGSLPLRLAYLHHIGPASIPEEVDGGRAIGHANSRHTLPLGALVGGAQELLAASRLVATDLFNAFGSPEVRHIAADGSLRPGYFGLGWQQVARIAGEDGVSITEEAVPGE
jgi:hypothetical protein